MTAATTDTSDPIRTPDRFATAVRKGDPLKFARQVAGLTEADRRKLSKSAQQLFREARKGSRDRFEIGITRGEQMACLALLAVGPRSAACRRMFLETWDWSFRRPFASSPHADAAVRILSDRRPAWADQWLEVQLGENLALYWSTVRRLIRQGVCRNPRSQAYAQLLSRQAQRTDLENDPDILDDLWLLFQYDTDAFYGVPPTNKVDLAKWKASPHSDRGWGVYWPAVLYHLAHHGRIDRGRLIDETLAALWREFNMPTRAGLTRFHDLLAPTEQEFLQRQAAYIELLRNPAPAVVTFALKAIKARAKLEGLDLDALLQGLAAVFEIPGKSQPKAALTLIRTIVKRRPDLKAAAVELAARALAHPDADVQLAAVKLLEQWRGDDLPLEALREAREMASPVVWPRLDELLGGTADDDAAGEPLPDGGAVADRIAQLRDRIGRLPAEVASPWKLAESLAAAEAGRLPPPVDIDAVPGVLSRVVRVRPIADVEELIDAAGKAFERIDSPMEVERILDGISRLGLERPPDFEARTDALRQRLFSGPTEFPSGGLDAVAFTFPHLILLLTEWLEIEVESRAESARPTIDALSAQLTGEVDSVLGRLRSLVGLGGRNIYPSVEDVLDYRAELVRQRLKKKRIGPLLSLPTQEHGWIDPRIFIERLRQACRAGVPLDDGDFAAGLLRLAPDFRDEAMRATFDLPDPVARIVRYALGGNEQPVKSDRPWKAQWLAAGRARSPRTELPELRVLGLPNGADGVEPARYRLRFDHLPSDGLRGVFERYALRDRSLVEVHPATLPSFPVRDYPVLVFSQRLARSDMGFVGGMQVGDWAEAWPASLWPANPEPFVANEIPTIVIGLQFARSSWVPIAPLLTPLLRPERAWTPTSIYALWLGLFSRDADGRAVAVDALVEGILDGRAHPNTLAPPLLDIARCEWAKLNRLANALRQAADVSGWANVVIANVLDALIATWQKPPRDAHHILELQLRLLMTVAGQLSDPARTPLKTLTGGGKTARLAKQLLELGDAHRTPVHTAALLETVAQRTSRAEQAAAADPARR